jgi:hypothetical protein
MYQADTAAVDFDLLVIVMDSSSIDLSLALCPWANFTGAKAAL